MKCFGRMQFKSHLILILFHSVFLYHMTFFFVTHILSSSVYLSTRETTYPRVSSSPICNNRKQSSFLLDINKIKTLVSIAFSCISHSHPVLLYTCINAYVYYYFLPWNKGDWEDEEAAATEKRGATQSLSGRNVF